MSGYYWQEQTHFAKNMPRNFAQFSLSRWWYLLFIIFIFFFLKREFHLTLARSNNFIWAPSSEFVSSSIPPWQILTAHAQPFRGVMDLAFCLKVPLDSLLVWASSGGSGETARMRRLAWTFAARIGDKYQIRLTRPISNWRWYIFDKYESKRAGIYCWNRLLSFNTARRRLMHFSQN